jgi:hypothetical protein
MFTFTAFLAAFIDSKRIIKVKTISPPPIYTGSPIKMSRIPKPINTTAAIMFFIRLKIEKVAPLILAAPAIVFIIEN